MVYGVLSSYFRTLFPEDFFLVSDMIQAGKPSLCSCPPHNVCSPRGPAERTTWLLGKDNQERKEDRGPKTQPITSTNVARSPYTSLCISDKPHLLLTAAGPGTSGKGDRKECVFLLNALDWGGVTSTKLGIPAEGLRGVQRAQDQ
jgi:hypothetical protein